MTKFLCTLSYYRRARNKRLEKNEAAAGVPSLAVYLPIWMKLKPMLFTSALLGMQDFVRI